MPTVLITGASGGIGAAIARRFAAGGWQVAIHYHRNEAAAMELQAELPGSMAVQADMASEAQVTAMVEQVQQRYGRIDALINNAGISQNAMFLDLTAADWKRVFDVNFFGTVYAIRAALPQMLHQDGGCIVNVSSIWGLKGASCESGYASTKAAIIGLTRSLAKEYGLGGIRVNCIAPGVIETPMNAVHSLQIMEQLAEEVPLGRIGKPEDVAELAWFLCQKEAGYITGQVLSTDGGWSIA